MKNADHLLLRKIVVTGPCEFEVLGIINLLRQKGFNVCNSKEMTAGPGDLLIFAMSAMPVLGYWKHIEHLQKICHGGTYGVVAIIPLSLKDVVVRKAICPVVQGDGKISTLSNELLAMADAWIKDSTVWKYARKDWLKENNQPVKTLSIGAIQAVQNLLSGKPVYRKVHYHHRYLAINKLGFANKQQFLVFNAGFASL